MKQIIAFFKMIDYRIIQLSNPCPSIISATSVKKINENCWVLTVARESGGTPACLFPQRTRKLPNGI